MKCAHYKTLREALGLTVKDVAELAGVHHNSAQRWESKIEPPAHVVRLLTEMWAHWAIEINEEVRRARATIAAQGYPLTVEHHRILDDQVVRNVGNFISPRQQGAYLGHLMMALTQQGVSMDIDYAGGRDE